VRRLQNPSQLGLLQPYPDTAQQGDIQDKLASVGTFLEPGAADTIAQNADLPR
jgi:hypothetical protein